MNHKIRKLLDKKNITGEELGKTYIRTTLQKNITGELFFTDEEIKTLVAKVIDPLEIDKFNAYIECYNWLDRSNLISEKHYEYFFVGLSILYLKLECTEDSEQGFNRLTKITESIKKEDNDYHRLKTFTENILTDISVFSQVETREYLEFMQNARSIVKVSLSNILSYNKAVDLLADFFKIPEILQVFKIKTEKLFTGINMLNDKIVLVRNFLYGSKDEIAKKTRILNDIYPMIDIQDFEPTEAAIKKASKSIKNSILSYNSYEIIKILNSKNNNE